MIGVPRSRLRMPTWISCGPSAISRSKPAAKLSRLSPGRPAIRSAWICTPVWPRRKRRFVFQPLVILAALDQLRDLLVEGLNAHLELERAGREPGDDLAQRLRQPVRHHLEVEEVPGPVPFEQELQDRPAGIDVQIEGPIHKLELPHAPVEQALQSDPSNAGSGACRTGMSSDERQNSHENGQPREAST